MLQKNGAGKAGRRLGETRTHPRRGTLKNRDHPGGREPSVLKISLVERRGRGRGSPGGEGNCSLTLLRHSLFSAGNLSRPPEVLLCLGGCSRSPTTPSSPFAKKDKCQFLGFGYIDPPPKRRGGLLKKIRSALTSL